MEKNKFKVGDIVRFYGDNNNKYRVLEIKEDGTLATESLISGNKYFFQQSQVEPSEKECPRKRLVKDMNDDIIKLGDIVRIYDGEERYKVTEINLKGMLVKLSTMDGKDKGVYGCGVIAKEKDLDKPRDKNGNVLHIGDKVRVRGWNRVYIITSVLNDNRHVILNTKEGDNIGEFCVDAISLVEEENLCSKNIGKDGSGKDDRADHKPRWELLPLDAIEEIVKVYTMGAEKYADDAWKTIPDAHRRYLAALFRHVAAYERGERLDKESGLSHLAHAAWNAIAILWLDINNKTGK